jgi:hypothetical protein
MEIIFKTNLDQLSKIYDKINKTIIPRASQQAINKTARGVKTDAVRSISKSTGIKQKDIRTAIEVNPSKKLTLNASVDSSSARGRNLISFVTKSQRVPGFFSKRKRLKSGKLGKYKAQGVKAKAWGNRKVYKGTFIGTGKNGNVLVFARKADSKKLKSIQGPSARQTFKSAKQKLANSRSATKRFAVEMPRAIKAQLSKLKVN